MNLYRFSIQDNESYAFRENSPTSKNQEALQSIIPDMSGVVRLGIQRCIDCGNLLDKWNETLTRLVIKKRKFDVSTTYDGIKVVSQRFRDVYSKADLTGAQFQQLPDDPDYYAIRPLRAVAFDAVRRGTRFLKRCLKCGCYESVVGATPVCLKDGCEIGEKEFVRTDLEFGSNDGKSPVILCGEAASHALKSGNLAGLEVIPIKDPFGSQV